MLVYFDRKTSISNKNHQFSIYNSYSHLNTCTSVLMDIKSIFSDSKKTLNQNKSVGSGDYRKCPNEKNQRKKILSYSIFEKVEISIKIHFNLQFLTFLVTVVELSYYQIFHFCKLDKILRNFPSWQNFVFVAVYEIFGFEFCHFML